jgi:hypothetical protein
MRSLAIIVFGIMMLLGPSAFACGYHTADNGSVMASADQGQPPATPVVIPPAKHQGG